MSSKSQEIADLISIYTRLTKHVLPSLAKNGGHNWPVTEDHCFQRIILDTICNGIWCEYIDQPAVKHLTADQAQLSVEMCQTIRNGHEDIHKLNRQSLTWRKKINGYSRRNMMSTQAQRVFRFV